MNVVMRLVVVSIVDTVRVESRPVVNRLGDITGKVAVLQLDTIRTELTPLLSIAVRTQVTEMRLQVPLGVVATLETAVSLTR